MYHNQFNTLVTHAGGEEQGPSLASKHAQIHGSNLAGVVPSFELVRAYFGRAFESMIGTHYKQLIMINRGHGNEAGRSAARSTLTCCSSFYCLSVQVDIKLLRECIHWEFAEYIGERPLFSSSVIIACVVSSLPF